MKPRATSWRWRRWNDGNDSMMATQKDSGFLFVRNPPRTPASLAEITRL
jgi:hypothetical protein